MVTKSGKLIFSFLFVGTLYTTDATISAWSEPVITTANGAPTDAYSFAESVATGTAGVAKTLAATADAAPVVYTLLTTGTSFAVASATGVLSLDTALDFETKASYTFEVQAVDATPTTGTATITVTVTDVNEAPSFGQTTYNVNIADGSTAGATLTTVPATDQDTGDVITYSIAAGNSAGHFSIAGSTGVITVATSQTLEASTTATYALKIEAADDDSPSLTGTTTIAVTVKSDSGSSGLLAGSLVVLMMSFLAVLK